MCDPDIDADGIDNESDNCPASANATQEDLEMEKATFVIRHGDGVPQEADSSDGTVLDNAP